MYCVWRELRQICVYTETPVDYISKTLIITFEPGVMEQCFDIAIVDDVDLETSEYFNTTLLGTGDLDDRIKLDPAGGVVMITDNDSTC